MLVRMSAVVTALLAASALAAPAYATGILLGYGAFAQTADLAPYSYLLENGVDRQNVLGGLGSGFAWAGGNTFLAAPDRGPNATTYAAGMQVDQTTSYIERFETVQMTLTPTVGSIPFRVTPTLVGTTLLSSASPLNYGSGGNGLPAGNFLNSGAPPSTYYYTGRSDNFAAGSSRIQNNGRLDVEGIRTSADGKSVFVSDEYGPYLYQFDRSTGSLIKTFTLPGYNNPSVAGNLYVPAVSALGAAEDKGGTLGNTTGRVQNKGMEALAITPDGKTLVGVMQAPLLQDGNASKLLRIVTVDVATGATHEYGYRLSAGSGVSEIVALNDHQFLVDERDGKGVGGDSGTPVKNLYLIDLSGAVDITNMTAAAAPVVGKLLVTDLAALLATAGLPVPSKIEGLAFGSDLVVDGTLEHTLWVANDNDFTPPVSGPSQFYVVGFSDADLSSLGVTFQAQSIQAIPEPGSITLLLPIFGSGALVAFNRKRRNASLQ